MKKSIFIAVLVVLAASVQYGRGQSWTQTVFTDNLKFCEGTTPYRQMMLVSNFGTEIFNPMNNEGKGYITVIYEENTRIFIPADGSLSAPKGMVAHQGRLYIADVSRVVVYNLKDLKEKPVTIKFPEGEDFVNDIVALSDIILVSVTNTGNIYGIDVSDPENLAASVPKQMGNIPGANGMAVSGNMLYVASYNVSGTPSEENVIYSYDLSSPDSRIQKLEGMIPGQYDGVAISNDGTKLYFSAWPSKDFKSAIYIYDLTRKEPVHSMGNLEDKFDGPADISIKGDYLWIPDLPQSTVYRIAL